MCLFYSHIYSELEKSKHGIGVCLALNMSGQREDAKSGFLGIRQPFAPQAPK